MSRCHVCRNWAIGPMYYGITSTLWLKTWHRDVVTVTNRGTNLTGDKWHHGIYVVHQTERVVLSDGSVLCYVMSQRQPDTQNTKSNRFLKVGFVVSWQPTPKCSESGMGTTLLQHVFRQPTSQNHHRMILTISNKGITIHDASHAKSAVCTRKPTGIINVCYSEAER